MTVNINELVKEQLFRIYRFIPPGRFGRECIENLKELVNAALAFQTESGINAATPASAGLAGTMQPAADGAMLPADAAPVVQVEAARQDANGKPDTFIIFFIYIIFLD